MATCSDVMQKEELKTPPEAQVAALLKTPEAHVMVKTRSTTGTSRSLEKDLTSQIFNVIAFSSIDKFYVKHWLIDDPTTH